MDWVKYDSIPTEFATAREIGLAPATLTAMARKNFIEATNTSPKKYRRIDSPAASLCRQFEKEEFFVVYTDSSAIGTLCYIEKDVVMDCWGRPYDVSKVVRTRRIGK